MFSASRSRSKGWWTISTSRRRWPVPSLRIYVLICLTECRYQCSRRLLLLRCLWYEPQHDILHQYTFLLVQCVAFFTHTSLIHVNMTLVLQDEIEQVILVGGATRVPRVQEALLKATKKYVFHFLCSLHFCMLKSLVKWCNIVSLKTLLIHLVALRDELAKNINADEAAAMGAVYQAAALSKAFKVKPFLIRDAAVFPIQVSEQHH